jgi:phosphatidylserine/phosphatidylglycerophosphate/cardiolipin synthase-like enzyme
MNPVTSSLHDEKTFYPAFLKDLAHCKREVIIESPFITSERMNMLWPILRMLYKRGVKIFIITRDPREHTEGYSDQSEAEIQALEALGIQVLLCTGNHHRKLAILDRTILWEGSLNILSQLHSREIMRRLEGGGFAVDMYHFLHFGRYI